MTAAPRALLRRLRPGLATLAALLLSTAARAAPDVLILTDASGAALNGATHVSNLVTAFTNTGASVTTNTTELTNGAAMAPALVTGWDAVLVVTVTGAALDLADVPVLQAAVSSAASRAFLFFTDACAGCTVLSANRVLPILNLVGGWSATLGAQDNTYPFNATLNGAGPYNAAFAALPVIRAGAYSPLLGVPAPNVIYTADAAVDGPMAVVAPGSGGSACLFMVTDVTEFWTSGGAITVAQANGLAPRS